MSKAKISLLRVVIDVSADHWMVVTVVKQWLQLGVAWTYLKRSIRQLDTLSVDWHASRHLQLPFPTVLTLQDSVHGITIASKTVRISTRTTTKSRSGSLPPPPGSRSQSSASGSSGASPNTSLNSNSTSNLTTYPWREVYHKMSYILVSTDDFHRGPTRISTIDPYLHEKVPFTVIKDSLYFQAEPQYDPHGRYWKFRVEDAPVRVLNKLLDLGYKVLTGTSLSGSFEHKQPGHAWTLFRDPNSKSTYSLLNSSH